MKHKNCFAIASFLLPMLSVAPVAVYAQVAGANADYNKDDRTNTRNQALFNYDKPLRDDPVGNALVGGAVNGVIKGSVAAAATSAAIRTTTGATADKLKEGKSK